MLWILRRAVLDTMSAEEVEKTGGFRLAHDELRLCSIEVRHHKTTVPMINKLAPQWERSFWRTIGDKPVPNHVRWAELLRLLERTGVRIHSGQPKRGRQAR